MARKYSPRRETEKRVSHIADLMVSGRWVTRATAQHLAVEWGVSEGRIGQLAAEASRRITESITDHDRDELRARLIATLDNVRARARMRTRHRAASVREGEGQQARWAVREWDEADPDFDAELRSLDLQAKLFGLYPTDRGDGPPAGGGVVVQHGVIILPAEQPLPQLVATTGTEVKKPNGSNGHGAR